MMRIISKFWMGVLSFFMIVLASCNALDDVKSDVEDLLGRVSSLEDAVKSLELAYADGKIVTSVESVNYNGGGVFADLL